MRFFPIPFVFGLMCLVCTLSGTAVRAQTATPAPFIAAVLKDAAIAAAQIAEPAERAEAQFDLARAFLSAGNGERAVRAYRTALETLAKVGDGEARGRLLSNHAGVIVRMPMAARPVLRRLVELRAESVPAGAMSLSHVAEEQAADDLPGALHTASRMPNSASLSAATLSIAWARAQRGDMAGAIVTINRQKYPESGLTTAQTQAIELAGLAKNLPEDNKDKAGVLQILDALHRLTPRLQKESNAYSALVFSFIAEAQSVGGRTAESRETRAAVLRSAKDKPWDEDALVRVAWLSLAEGETKQGFAALDALRSASNAAPLTVGALRGAILALTPAPNSLTAKEASAILAAIRHAAPVLGDDAFVLTAEILERRGQIGDAVTEAAKIQDGEKGSAALLRLAEKQIEAGDSAGAKPTLDAAASATVRISYERQRWPNRERVARLRARSGDIAGAVAGAKAITDPKSAAAAYGDILIEQLTATDYTGAQETALAIPDPYLRDRMLVNIAAWQVKADNKGFPYRFVDEDYPLWVAGDKPRNADIPAAQQTAGFIVDPSYRSAALSLIAQTQIILNNREGATRTALLIPDDAARSGTLAALATSRDAAGDTAGAEEAARQITTIEGKILYLTARAGRKAQRGDIAGARADYATAADIAAGQLPADRLAPLQASAGKMTLALDASRRFFDKTGDREIFLNVWEAYLLRPRFPNEPLMLPDALAVTNYLRDETLRRVTEWAANRKDFVTAAAAAPHIGDAPHRLSAYLTLARENKAASLSALQQARAAALSLHEPDSRFRALLSVIDGG